MRISDWSSDVCSSDLTGVRVVMDVLITPIERRGRPGPCRVLPFSLCQKTVGARFCGRARRLRETLQIGRESRRERVCQYVSISVVAGSFENTVSLNRDVSGNECTDMYDIDTYIK